MKYLCKAFLIKLLIWIGYDKLQYLSFLLPEYNILVRASQNRINRIYLLFILEK